MTPPSHRLRLSVFRRAWSHEILRATPRCSPHRAATPRCSGVSTTATRRRSRATSCGARRRRGCRRPDRRGVRRRPRGGGPLPGSGPDRGGLALHDRSQRAAEQRPEAAGRGGGPVADRVCADLARRRQPRQARRLGGRALGARPARRLPPEQREAVRARVLDERDYADIARELHTSELVVRKRVSRGLATLRTHMEKPT